MAFRFTRRKRSILFTADPVTFDNLTAETHHDFFPFLSFRPFGGSIGCHSPLNGSSVTSFISPTSRKLNLPMHS
jgi:hypothetical protein